MSRGYLASVFAAVSVATLAGCGDRDAFTIRFNNDLRIPVVVALCHSDHSAVCEHPYYRDKIRPGGATEENISPDVSTEWAIESATGRPLHCILLYWKRWPKHDMQVAVSAAPKWANPCPRRTPASALK